MYQQADGSAIILRFTYTIFCIFSIKWGVGSILRDFPTFFLGIYGFEICGALLFAPRTGSETRSMLGEKGLEIRDKATELARDTRDRAQQSLLDARNKMQEKMRSMKEGAFITAETRQMKEEMEYMEEISNRDFPL